MDSIVLDNFESVVKSYISIAYTRMSDAMTKKEFLKWNYRCNAAYIVLDDFMLSICWPVAKDADDLLYLLAVYEERYKYYSSKLPLEVRSMYRESFMAIRTIKKYFKECMEEYQND